MTTITEFKVTPASSLVDGVTTIVFDHKTPIADQLQASAAFFAAADVCLDFAEIETVCSAELSALIRFALRIRRLEKSVSMCNVGPLLQEIFEITRFGAWGTS